ncbi:MAG: hypothetical protein ABSA11_11550 [Candidatus Bathyarchaeia archaeon]|jgi:hypothetical protein
MGHDLDWVSEELHDWGQPVRAIKDPATKQLRGGVTTKLIDFESIAVGC